MIGQEVGYLGFVLMAPCCDRPLPVYNSVYIPEMKLNIALCSVLAFTTVPALLALVGHFPSILGAHRSAACVPSQHCSQ